jgi:EAL domain-containing protein (putative c-di-GMP-specific phosphodiesterase class I)
VRIALDDFGTGYASLTHLQKFPVDAIKIDQSFVRSIATDPGSQAITSAVLELGRRLGKDVIAEGVETEEHADILRAAGCRQAQGYLFARPMPIEALVDYMATAHDQSLKLQKAG